MKKKIFLVCLGLIFFVCAQGFAANDYEDAFKRNLYYDIYFLTSEDNLSIIENVQIVGFKEVAEKLFLMIKGKGLKLKEEEGFIAFDTVQAILPERNFKIRNVERIKTNY